MCLISNVTKKLLHNGCYDTLSAFMKVKWHWHTLNCAENKPVLQLLSLNIIHTYSSDVLTYHRHADY